MFLKKFIKNTAHPWPEQIAGVLTKVSARAGRFSLRYDDKCQAVVLVWPEKLKPTAARLVFAQKFVAAHQDWILQQNETHIKNIKYAGDNVLVHGQPYSLHYRPGRGVDDIVGSHIFIHGDARHFQGRVTRLLKKYAALEILPILRAKEAVLNLSPSDLKLFDPKTRWGSCTARGRVMLSWRLILAPPVVMDYVIAHEIAHRVHMNHGAKFWALCDDLADDSQAAQDWLKKEGRRLMSLRFSATPGS